MAFENFPYTNFHDLNLDWILKICKEYATKFNNYDDALKKINERLEKTETWINDYDPNYIKNIVEKYLKEFFSGGVYFSISDAGYFVTHIPKNLQALQFGTTGLDIYVPLHPEYGHLTISY